MTISKSPESILVTGGTGFIGRILCERLQAKGHRLIVLTRNPAKYKSQQSVTQRFIANLDEISDDTIIHTIINLAGEPLAEGRWTEVKKQRFIQSRLDITNAVVALSQRLEQKPSLLLSSSAIGYYGPQADTEITEDHAPADCFLHRLCAQWEEAALAIQNLGVRCCLLRIGMVLGPQGGPLQQFRLPFRFKVAARLGDGKQWMSWIHQEDIINILFFLMEKKDIQGPVNLTAPLPVTNGQFTSMVGQIMRSWVSVSVPAVVVKVLVGELGTEVLLVSQRVLPAKLQNAGYRFTYNELTPCLEELLVRKN